ncbi:MAG TPA: F0F1 ATP synthase subunit B [Gammaproteobacteria bacterium]|jgi:F-type H+-transporting ATPase subunit b|nr:F0F1 ATP synthase subunit B [Gammaproteobacteria bacterium]
MDINATIIGQFITFAILVWFSMKYVWPPITKAMHEREKKIAAGLAAAEESKRQLALAADQSASIVHQARQEATSIVDKAHAHGMSLIEEAKSQAKIEGARIIEMAQGDITREVAQAKAALKSQLADLVVTGAEKVIRLRVDSAAHTDLLNQLAEEI